MYLNLNAFAVFVFFWISGQEKTMFSHFRAGKTIFSDFQAGEKTVFSDFLSEMAIS